LTAPDEFGRTRQDLGVNLLVFGIAWRIEAAAFALK
jgi:hypothetical protein